MYCTKSHPRSTSNENLLWRESRVLPVGVSVGASPITDVSSQTAPSGPELAGCRPPAAKYTLLPSSQSLLHGGGSPRWDKLLAWTFQLSTVGGPEEVPKLSTHPD